MLKKIGISGSWRTVNDAVECAVRKCVRAIITDGNTMVSGGALGVDWIATDEAMLRDPSYHQIRVILPTPLETYAAHYFNRAAEGVITLQQAKNLISQLSELRRVHPLSVKEMDFNVCTPDTYYARNQAVVDVCDELVAFQVNNSQGTQDTIDKALAQRKKVMVFEYAIEP